MKIRTPFFLSVAAGLFVAVGGCVYLGSDNRYVGALLFSVALLSISYMGLYLYTGRIGYIAIQHGRDDVVTVLVTLLGNTVSALIAGLAAGYMKPQFIEGAASLCRNKLEMSLGQVFIAAVFCGLLMYTAVELFKNGKTPLGIIYCIPAFILSGFEHSIADMFYVFTARIFTAEAVLFLLVVVLGNSLGGMLVPGLKIAAGERHG